jgi:hypothetical protein
MNNLVSDRFEETKGVARRCHLKKDRQVNDICVRGIVICVRDIDICVRGIVICVRGIDICVRYIDMC